MKRNGFFLVDKPLAWSSYEVVDRIKRRFGIEKVGHAGTLDPAATGLLVVLCGSYTKKFPLFQKMKKGYLAEVLLGEERDSLDREGRVVERCKKEIDFEKEEILETLESFRGEIDQVPPRFSAVKVGGVPAYKLARKGKKMELEPKKVTIYKLELEKVELPKIKLEIVCSSGTYIRSLARDIGKKLGVGAYLFSLRRTRIGRFEVGQAKKPVDLSIEDLLSEL